MNYGRAPCYYIGYFVQWFKILVYIECQPVWQLVLSPPPFVCVAFQSFFPTHSSFNSNSVFLWLFPSSLPTHLFTCHFPFMSITVSPRVSFLRRCAPSLFFIPPLFHCLRMQSLPAYIFCLPLSLYWHPLPSLLSISEFSLSSPETLPSSLHPSCRTLLPFTSSPSPPSHPTHSSFPPMRSIFSPSPSIVVPGNEWVTWICLFTLQPLPSAAQEHLWKKKTIVWLPPCPHLWVRV